MVKNKWMIDNNYLLKVPIGSCFNRNGSLPQKDKRSLPKLLDWIMALPFSMEVTEGSEKAFTLAAGTRA
jgi:hypothetical protein